MKRFFLAAILAGMAGQAMAQDFGFDFDERQDYRRAQDRSEFVEQHRYDRALPNVEGCRLVSIPQRNGDVVTVHRAVCHQFDQ